MKTTIITAMVVILLSITNQIFASDKLYKTVVGDKESGVITTTLSQRSFTGYLTPLKQIVFHYNSNKILKQRTSYKWDVNKKEWVLVGQHKYEYNDDKKLMIISYMCWNEASKSWNKDTQYAMYTYDADNECPPVKYLSVLPN